MRLLLDTHVFIRALTAHPQLKAPARELIAAADWVRVSAASLWEIAIKSGLGTLKGDVAAFAGAIEASGFHELAVTARHAVAMTSLPPHHTDPFDRLLLAQAFTEPLRLVTADETLLRYGGAIELI